MVTHWEKFGPPVYVAAAAYMGLIKADGKTQPSGNPAQATASKPIGATGERGNLNDLAQLLSGSGGILNG